MSKRDVFIQDLTFVDILGVIMVPNVEALMWDPPESSTTTLQALRQSRTGLETN